MVAKSIKMKIEELMIGDIVEYLDVDQPVPVVVVKIDGPSSVVCLKQKNGHKFNTTIEYLRPIPLIPEILKKIGYRITFEGELHTTYFQDIDGFGVEIKIDCIGFTKLSMLNGLGYRIIIECKYLHQLQHAFSICKINKQISLP